MTQWTQREHGKGEIDRAGQLLVPWWEDPNVPGSPEVSAAYGVVQNWRTSHALPLNVFQAALRKRAAKVDSGVIVAQRLKRFISVMNKLVREPRMKLSQMQDLGGCRAILSSVKEVERLYEIYKGSETLFGSSTQPKCYDYIRHPKPDGYRGIHIVGRYTAHIDSREPWNGHRIEIQARSRLQHAFATAVETVTTFTREPLKFGAGPVPWRRFFSLWVRRWPSARAQHSLKEPQPMPENYVGNCEGHQRSSRCVLGCAVGPARFSSYQRRIYTDSNGCCLSSIQVRVRAHSM
jgi:hypothetical protein